MCRRLVYLISIITMLSVVTDTSADLVAHLRFDEESGTVASDTSGNGNDGVLNGDPRWVAGYVGGALEFDGDGDYVEMARIVQDDFTLMAWIKTDTPGLSLGGQGYQGSGLIWSDVGGVANDFILAILGTKLSFFCGNPDTSVNSDKDVVTDDWVHVAATRSAQDQEIAIFIDGEQEKSVAHANSGSLNALDTIAIGGNVLDSRYYTGLVDDVQLYDNVLLQVEILSAMQNEPWPYAYNPDPPDGAIHADTWITLSWMSGQLAASHDVYLGDNFDEVNNGTGDTYRGNQIATFFVAGFPGFAYPEGLVPGTTYYWRIDEVNDANPDSPWKGEIWSFSIPPKTAYNPNPADGTELADPNTVKLSWTAGFGAILHTVFFGDDFDEVDNATVGIPSGTTSYSPGQLEREKVYYWRVDEFDALVTHKGDTWTFTTPGAVGNPQPAIGALDVGMNATLSWTPADSAASHQLYLGTDKAAVRNAETTAPAYKGSIALGIESHDPGLLEADTTYYWRVDPVDAQGNALKGPIWSFTTGAFLLVDDFESYTDDDTAGLAIWQTWIDGFGIADNGAQVGYLMPPYAEQAIVHGGGQSMPLLFVNEAGVTNSEGTMMLTAPRNWTTAGVAVLSLWFRGDSANAPEPLYAGISNAAGALAVAAHDDPSASTAGTWTPWQVPLQVFTEQGINLTNVDKIAIGLGSKSGTAATGGSGTVYIDDIRLY